MTALLLRVLDWILGRTSLATARHVGEWLALVWFHLVPIRRATSIRQIRAALGVGRSAARRIARDTYVNLGRSAAEFLRMEEAATSVRASGWERYVAARAQGRGVLVVTGHFGNWDLLACSQALRGEPLHVVTKRLSDRGTDALWMERRRRAGVRLHDATGSLGAVVRALRAGEVVGLVIDQDTPPAKGGVLVPFLGRPAFTTATPAVLALRTGATLLPVFLVRDDDGRGHEMRIGEPIPTDDVLPDDAGIRTVVSRCNTALEEAIHAHPAQWLWLHRRWRSAERVARS